ncbi:uncharacterized protein LOC133173410 [Saccostrea echinata]|uniref:uncharacterized protein LOC133173410 n=1 Tax=Saccostrea echinata TaxID=191078 RepID=UPI002A7EDF33|nr:uncharacterized protein LOC133173410 [Saccostrea echinata]
MGYDTDFLSIVNMNASGRKGHKFMDFRKFGLHSIVENEKPNLLFLPGDDPDPDTLIKMNYETLTLEQAEQETVLLYDVNRLRLRSKTELPEIQIPGLEYGKYVAPMMQILPPQPRSQESVVKEFVCVSWHYSITRLNGSQNLFEIGRRLMIYAEFMAWASGSEVLIGGDFNLEVEQIDTLIKEHNQRIEQHVDDLKPFFESEYGLMPCMTETTQRPMRRQRQLKLHKCVKSKAENFFIASKEMQLCHTRNVQLDRLAYSATALKVATKLPEVDPNPTRTRQEYQRERPKPSTTDRVRYSEYCPAPSRTEMYIPQRPPKHHGG